MLVSVTFLIPVSYGLTEREILQHEQRQELAETTKIAVTQTEEQAWISYDKTPIYIHFYGNKFLY